MEELANLEAERGTPGYGTAKQGTGERAASDAMCAFLILNISSLQLIPVNMIVYRTKYGSDNPSGIILPAIVATCCSTLAGIIYIKMRYGRKDRC